MTSLSSVVVHATIAQYLTSYLVDAVVAILVIVLMSWMSVELECRSWGLVVSGLESDCCRRVVVSTRRPCGFDSLVSSESIAGH
jgi:hypothetical protein